MQIKPQGEVTSPPSHGYYQEQQKRTKVGEDVQKSEPWWGWRCSLWKTVWQFIEEFNAELPDDPGIPRSGLGPKEVKAGN